jgi:hypothetical protein
MHSLKWNFIKLKISDTVANFTAMYVYIQWNCSNYKKLQRFILSATRGHTEENLHCRSQSATLGT